MPAATRDDADTSPRTGWQEAFERALTEDAEDSLVLDESPNAADQDEWTW